MKFSLTQFMDSISIRMMLGSLQREIAAKYEKSGHPNKQAQRLASQEMNVSLLAHGISLNSYPQVKAWKTSYMAERTKILTKED